MSTDITQAAISYFGLPEGATLVEGGPVGAFAFIIPLTEEHLRGIADRMKAMAEPPPPAPAVFVPDVPLSILRAEYNRLNREAKARYGSFGAYAATWARGAPAADVAGGGA